MPNKAITAADPADALTPLAGGMDDTFNLWAQVDGGGPSSSYAVSWAQLFIAKNAVAASNNDGTDIELTAGDGDGTGAGGYITLRAGSSAGLDAYGGYIELFGGDGGYYGGTINARAGDGGDYGGGATLRAGAGTSEGGDLKLYSGASETDAGHVKLYAGAGAAGNGGNIYIAPGSGAIANGFLYIARLPTATPGGTNRVWRDAGVLKIT